METAQCLVDRAVKLDAVDTTSVDGRGAELDNIDVERILERACYGARRRLPLYQAPEFTKRLKTLENVRTGEKAHFECIWSAFPRPAVKWYHDDEEINTDDVRFEIESLRRGVLKLTLKSVTKADEGSYKCKAENQEGVTSTTGYLTVTGDSRKSRSRESRRKRQRAVSLPPHLRTITEQSSLEEREEVACSRQPRSPIQDFIDNIEAFRKDRTWPLLSRHHGNDSKRLSTAQHWEDDGGSGTAESGAAGGKLSFERVLDNCENPFARRPLLPYSDDRVTSEGDVTPNGCDVSPPSRPTSLHLAAGKNAGDPRGRLPGRIAFPHAKTCKLKNDAGERTVQLVMRKPATAATRKTSPSKNHDNKQRDRVSPVPTKEKVYARVSGILRNHQPIDSSETSVTGLADAIADRGRRTHAAYPPELVRRTGSPVRQADSSESPERRSVNSSEHRSANSPERRSASHKRRSANSSESPVRQPVFSIDSPVGGPVISSESPAGGPVISNESPVHGPVISGESPVHGAVISSESPVHGAVISSESPVHGAFISSESPMNGAVISSESPARGSVISSESPARGSVISSESPMHGAVISSESPMHGAVISSESPMHGAVISNESPARGSVISNKSPWRPPVIATKTVRMVQGPAKPAVPGPAKPAVPGPAKPAVPGPAKPAVSGPAKPAMPGPAKPAVPGPTKPAMPAAAAKVSPRTCTTVVTPMAPYKGDPQRPVWLYFLLFVTCCACVGCVLQAYPANFIFVVTALSVISFRLLLHRADFLGES